ncbi:MAG: c-type cytochrome [Phenylobacterium sp.]
MRRHLPIAAAIFTLAACAPKPPPVDPATLKPADARLAALYAGACRACHLNPQSGAPVVGDAKAWSHRWAQGEDVLLDHVIQGYRGMPASGQCAACTPDDLKALIRFLAGRP